MDTDLQAVRETICQAGLSSDAERIALWSVDRLPKLYADFIIAYDSRFADDILRWVETLLKALQEKAAIADDVRERLVSMHERLGLPKLAFKVPTVRKTRPRKTAKS